MATAIAYSAVNMGGASADLDDFAVKKATSTYIELYYEYKENNVVTFYATHSFYGQGLTYGPGGIIGGTITSDYYYEDGALIYSIYGGEYSAVSIYNYIVSKDTPGLFSYIFAGSDQLSGSNQNDALYAYGGDDILDGGGGNDILNGGDGSDIVSYAGLTYADWLARFSLVKGEYEHTYVVTDIATGATDTLIDNEWLYFSNVSIPLDILLGDFDIKGWGFKDVQFTLVTGNSFSGQGKIEMPFARGYELDVALGFTLIPFELDSASLTVGLPAPLPIFSTGWSVTSIGGGVSNLASTSAAPVLYTGTLGVESAGKVVEMDLTASVDANHATGTGTGHVIKEDLVQFTGEAILDWEKDSFGLDSNASFFDGAITGSFKFKSDFDLNFSAKSTAQVEILGQSLSGNYYLLFSNDDILGNDYVAGWVTTDIYMPFWGTESLTKGIKYTFDGNWSTFGASEVPLYSSWIVDETIADLMVTVEWENAAVSPVQTRVVVYDDLAKTQIREIIDEADYLAHNIAVIDDWSSAYGKVIYIAAPEPGLWDVEVINPAGLGEITYSATTSLEEGSLSIGDISVDGQLVTIDYSAIDPGGLANVHFFADDDNEGFDGLLLGSTPGAGANDQFVWDVTGLSPGEYWIYAIQEDGQTVPLSIYAPDSIIIDGPGGSSGINNLFGTDYADTISAQAGSDRIDGLGGLDTVMYAGTSANYVIAHTDAGFTVTDLYGTDGEDSLINVERLEFADAKIALDIDGNAGKVYRLYEAAFNRTPDKPGLAYWIWQADAGASFTQIASAFTGGIEFQNKYGTLSNNQFIEQLYLNILDRQGEAGGLAYWQWQLNDGFQTREEVLIGFSESYENQIHVIGQIENGIDYTV